MVSACSRLEFSLKCSAASFNLMCSIWLPALHSLVWKCSGFGCKMNDNTVKCFQWWCLIQWCLAMVFSICYLWSMMKFSHWPLSPESIVINKIKYALICATYASWTIAFFCPVQLAFYEHILQTVHLAQNAYCECGFQVTTILPQWQSPSPQGVDATHQYIWLIPLCNKFTIPLICYCLPSCGSLM